MTGELAKKKCCCKKPPPDEGCWRKATLCECEDPTHMTPDPYIPCSFLQQVHPGETSDPIVFMWRGLCWYVEREGLAVSKIPPSGVAVYSLGQRFDTCEECCGSLEGSCADCWQSGLPCDTSQPDALGLVVHLSHLTFSDLCDNESWENKTFLLPVFLYMDECRWKLDDLEVWGSNHAWAISKVEVRCIAQGPYWRADIYFWNAGITSYMVSPGTPDHQACPYGVYPYHQSDPYWYCGVGYPGFSMEPITVSMPGPGPLHHDSPKPTNPPIANRRAICAECEVLGKTPGKCQQWYCTAESAFCPDSVRMFNELLEIGDCPLKKFTPEDPV